MDRSYILILYIYILDIQPRIPNPASTARARYISAATSKTTQINDYTSPWPRLWPIQKTVSPAVNPASRPQILATGAPTIAVPGTPTARTTLLPPSELSHRDIRSSSNPVFSIGGIYSAAFHTPSIRCTADTGSSGIV